MNATAPPRPRIALISATPAAIAPAVAAFADVFPDAEPWNLLDDTLMTDADALGGLTPALAERMRRLIGYAVEGGAQGVLLTCSLYGPVAERTAPDVDVPVLAADAAAFAAALAGGHRRVLVLATFQAALSDALERFRAAARAAGSSVDAVGRVIVPGGPPPRREGADAVLLAQYSLAPHTDELKTALGLPVHAGPRAAARVLRAVLGDTTAPSARGAATSARGAEAEGGVPCSE